MDHPFDAMLFHTAVVENNIVWRKHALEKMLLRGIRREQVLEVLSQGELIQVYDQDRPFPSILLLGFLGTRPIHVVAAFDEALGIVFIITAYEPDLNIFGPDFKTKKK